MIKRLLLYIGLPFLLLVVIGAIFVLRDPTLWLMVQSNNSKDRPALFSDNLESISREDRQKALDKGAAFLLSTMTHEAWEGHPGISSICLRSLAGLAPKEKLKPALDFVLSCQQEDGGFAIPLSISLALKNYTTSVAIMALADVDSKTYAEQIEKGKNFLIKAQLDEDDGINPDDPNYGGFGYGGMGKNADLSNSHLALEALKKSGVKEDDPVFLRAQSFLRAAQDREGNPADWGDASGGFVYSPIKASEDPGAAYPYGAMSFAGLKSLILTGAKADDPRVKDVMSWIEKNYQEDVHLAKGQLSLFYYFATMATTLDLSGIDELQKQGGTSHNWHKDVTRSLLKRQRDDGSWINTTRKYMEGLPALATAYGLMALKSVDPEKLD